MQNKKLETISGTTKNDAMMFVSDLEEMEVQRENTEECLSNFDF